MISAIKHDGEKVRADLLPPSYWAMRVRRADVRARQLFEYLQWIASDPLVVDAWSAMLVALNVDGLSIAEVLTYGARKYGARNWERGLDLWRVHAALGRHVLSAVDRQEEVDQESGLSHLAHAACNCVFAIHYLTEAEANQ